MPTINRWRVLTGAVLILLCTGAIYAFSVWVGPLAGAHDWTPGQVVLGFTINGAISPIPMILGGFFVDRGWTRYSVAAGALLFAGGFALAGTASSLGMYYFWYGIVAGLGMGFAYSGCLSNTIKLFPDRKGFASGVLTAALGTGTVIAAPVAQAIIKSAGPDAAYVRMGLVYLVIVIAGALLIKTAPVGFVPEGWTPPAGAPAVVNRTWKQMLAMPVFYLIFAMLFAGAFSGLMIGSQLSPIAQTPMFAITAATAAVLVSVYAICQAIGRFAWGAISDRVGYINAVIVIYVVVAVSFVVMLTMNTIAGFVIGIIGLGLAFGGVMGVFPALSMNTFGPRFQGINYGIIFTGYAIAAYFGPKVGSSLGGGATGDYTQPFIIAIVIAAVGVVIALATRVVLAKTKSQAPATPAGVSA